MLNGDARATAKSRGEARAQSRLASVCSRIRPTPCFRPAGFATSGLMNSSNAPTWRRRRSIGISPPRTTSWSPSSRSASNAWAVDWVEAEARGRASEPEQQLLAIFDLFDEWFRREDFEGCTFINVMLEMGSVHPVGSASVRHLENIREMVRPACRGRRFARSVLVRALVAHPDEGVDRAGRRGRPRRRGASQGDGPAADRRTPLDPCPPTCWGRSKRVLGKNPGSHCLADSRCNLPSDWAQGEGDAVTSSARAAIHTEKRRREHDRTPN